MHLLRLKCLIKTYLKFSSCYLSRLQMLQYFQIRFRVHDVLDALKEIKWVGIKGLVRIHIMLRSFYEEHLEKKEEEGEQE